MLTRFEKWKEVTAIAISLGVLAVSYAGYRLNAEHERRQQITDTLKASEPPQRTIPNLNTKPVEQPTQQQTSKQPDKPVEQPQQNSTNSPQPDTTPKEPPKEEPKPYTFWGYFQTGTQLRPGILFQVNSCNVGKNLVTCSMEAVSPNYDRTFSFNSFSTTITDHVGDQFQLQLHSFTPLQLDRDAPVPFRLDFPVNKDVVEPITVRINGFDSNAGTIQKAAFVLGAEQ